MPCKVSLRFVCVSCVYCICVVVSFSGRCVRSMINQQSMDGFKQGGCVWLAVHEGSLSVDVLSVIAPVLALDDVEFRTVPL